VGTRDEGRKTSIGRKERKEVERDNPAHVEWMRRNEREGGKERGQILNEDGREIGWMK
jgi:hypothetical protein